MSLGTLCLLLAFLCQSSHSLDSSAIIESAIGRLNDALKSRQQELKLNRIIDVTSNKTELQVVDRIPTRRPVQVFDPYSGRMVTVQTLAYQEVPRRITIDDAYTFSTLVQIGNRGTEQQSKATIKVSYDFERYSAVTHFLLHDTSLFNDVKPREQANLELSVEFGSALQDGSSFETVNDARRSADGTAEPCDALSHHTGDPSTDNEWNAGSVYGHERSCEQASTSSAVHLAELDILCVNLWNYNHWKRRIPLLAEQFTALTAGVIAFQEVRARKISPHKSNRFQVADLMALLPGYQFVYEPAMGFHESHEEYVHEGLAIFSKYAIVESEKLLLSRDTADSGDFHQRICLRALIDSPIGLVNVLTTHMSLSEQARQRTLPEIGRFAAASPYPVVLLGDLNAVLEDINILNEYGLEDAWLEATRKGLNQCPPQRREISEDTAPVTPCCGCTFNSWDLNKRIDYVFTKGLVVRQFSVEGFSAQPSPKIEPSGGVSDMHDQLFPSDHLFPRVSLAASVTT